jgi:hypothetical protein
MSQTISEKVIRITIKREGEEEEVVKFENSTYGQRRSVKYVNELAKKHLQHAYNRLMNYADKKNDSDAKDFLRKQPFEKPPALSIVTEILEKEIDDLL